MDQDHLIPQPKGQQGLKKVMTTTSKSGHVDGYELDDASAYEAGIQQHLDSDKLFDLGYGKCIRDPVGQMSGSGSMLLTSPS